MKPQDAHTMRWVRAYAILAILLAALVAGWALSSSILASPSLLIEAVEVKGLVYLNKDDVLQRADLDQPKSTLKVQNEEVLARLLADPWIDQVQLQRPRREVLGIVIQEAKPRVVIATPTLMLADASGTVIDHVVPMYEDLPLLTGATRKLEDRDTPEKTGVDDSFLALSRGMGGTPVDQELEEAVDKAIVRDAVGVLDAWRDLKQHRAWPIDELSWDAGDGFTVWLDGRVELKLGHRNFEERLQRAISALEMAEDETYPLTRIDVRSAQRAVVRFDVQDDPEGDHD